MWVSYTHRRADIPAPVAHQRRQERAAQHSSRQRVVEGKATASTCGGERKAAACKDAPAHQRVSLTLAVARVVHAVHSKALGGEEGGQVAIFLDAVAQADEKHDDAADGVRSLVSELAEMGSAAPPPEAAARLVPWV